MSSHEEEEFYSSSEEINDDHEYLEKSGTRDFDPNNFQQIRCQLITDDLINNNDPLTRVRSAIWISKIIANGNSLYTDSEKEKILKFYTKELMKLNKNSEFYSEYSDLLKNLEETKAYNLGFELFDQETREEIFEKLFIVIFNLVEEDLEEDLKSRMLSILDLVLKQSENLSFDLLHNFFLNILEPQKSSRKETYRMTIELLWKRHEDFKGFWTNYFNYVKEQGDQAVEICRLYSIAYELRNIFPEIIHDTMVFYAESKILSPEEKARISSITFLGKMFSNPNSSLATKEPNLFKNFLRRINDISVEIRLLMIEFLKRIILKHPEFRNATSRNLRETQVDPDVNVRIKGVTSICEVIFKDLGILEGNEDLKQFLRGVKPDSEFLVRKVELLMVAKVFEKHIDNCMELSSELRNTLLSIPTRFFYAYSIDSFTDKYLISKLFRENLVSYDLPSKERMKRLYYLFATLHVSVLDSFTELNIMEFLDRKVLEKWVKLVKDPGSRKEIFKEFETMAKFKQGPMGSTEFLKAFEIHLMGNPDLANQLEIIVGPHVSCQEKIQAFNNARGILKNPHWKEAWDLIENGTSFIIDDEAIKDLVDLVFKALGGDSIAEEFDLDAINTGDRGLELLKVLVNYFPASFDKKEIRVRFVNYLKIEEQYRRSLMFSILATLGKWKPLYEILNSDWTLELLLSSAKKLSIEGTPKESKQSIRCLKFATPNFDLVYEEILKIMNSTLEPSSEFFLGSVVALGHIAIERPEGKCHQVEDLILKVIDYLNNYEGSEVLRNSKTSWCSENELSKGERSCEEAVKCLARWIFGIKSDSETLKGLANTVFSILHPFLLKPYSLEEPTMNRLRAKAACSILKICEKKELRHSIPLQIFYDLSKMMNDQSIKANKLFIRKLIKGLKDRLPKQFLTNEFLGFFVLARKQEKLITEINSAFEVVVARRNFFVSYLMNYSGSDIFYSEEIKERIFEWLPEFSIVYALPILARDPDFTEINFEALNRMDEYLWQFLQPIVEKSNFSCSIFFKTIGEKLKSFSDAHSTEFNEKLAALNELFLLNVSKRIKKDSVNPFNLDLKIPRTHYTEIESVDYSEPSIVIQRFAKNSRKKKLLMDLSITRGKRARHT